MTDVTQLYDMDAVVAVADLCARAGAKSFEIGYLDDEPPHRWYAQCFLRGARVIADEKEGPDEAADALARKLIGGGKCTACGRKVALSNPRRYDCHWFRDRDAWVQGCNGKRRATRDGVTA